MLTDTATWDRAIERLLAAIHMLHEQAHGEVPFVTCGQPPCNRMLLDLRGPAPLNLP